MALVDCGPVADLVINMVGGSDAAEDLLAEQVELRPPVHASLD